MSEKHYELCFLCDRETGRAGPADDSIFCDDCYNAGDEMEGPYCEECWRAHARGHEIQKRLTQSQITTLESEKAELVAANADVRARIHMAESIIKKFGSNVAIGEPSWNAVIRPEIENYQGIYFNSDEVLRVDLTQEGGGD